MRSRALPHRSEETAAKASRSSRPPKRGRRPLVHAIPALAILSLAFVLAIRHGGGGGCALEVSAGGATWSANARVLAFARRSSTGFHVYTFDLRTRRVGQLTHSHCGNEVAPAWSPDGQRLAYERSAAS
jgi:hypothetical protein